MRDFEFLEPASVSEASRMLADLGDDCRAMAGGTALMLAMRQRMLVPSHIVSLARIDALRGIDFDTRRGLRIGALARHNEVARSPLVQQHYPVLASMAAGLATLSPMNRKYPGRTSSVGLGRVKSGLMMMLSQPSAFVSALAVMNVSNCATPAGSVTEKLRGREWSAPLVPEGVVGPDSVK